MQPLAIFFSDFVWPMLRENIYMVAVQVSSQMLGWMEVLLIVTGSLLSFLGLLVLDYLCAPAVAAKLASIT